MGGINLKAGGHQGSCALMTTIMSVLSTHALHPEDPVAVKADTAQEVPRHSAFGRRAIP
jgi:hypothetical protein